MKSAAIHVPQHMLLPANPVFIAVSLILAFLLDFLPWSHSPYLPDFLALVLVFWNVHQPRKVGIGIAFMFGLLVDVHHASLIGEHALAYSLMSYLAVMMHRRVLWFNLLGQTLHLMPLMLLTQLVPLFVRMMLGAAFPGWMYFVQSLVSAACWPLLSWLLLAPQRRAINRDENRPL